MTNLLSPQAIYQTIRSETNKADQALARLERHRKRIIGYCVRNGYSEHQMREKFKIDYDYQDAWEAYTLACSEVQRLERPAAGRARLPTAWRLNTT